MVKGTPSGCYAASKIIASLVDGACVLGGRWKPLLGCVCGMFERTTGMRSYIPLILLQTELDDCVGQFHLPRGKHAAIIGKYVLSGL